MTTAIAWLRRELRVHDNPVLHSARAHHRGVVPVFCLDDRLLRGRHASGPRTRFLLECLADLATSLQKRGSGLVLLHGPPHEQLPRLAAALGAGTLVMSEDVGPFARERDRGVATALERAGVDVRRAPALFAVDDLGAIATASGDPYTVFTPFHRAWLAQPRREPVPTPRRLPPLPRGAVPTSPSALPAVRSFGLDGDAHDAAPGGETAARKAMCAFLAGAVRGYAEGRNALGGECCSRLSPYLHFGALSAAELERRLPGGRGADAYRRQLCWRDFYAHVLLHFPADARREHQLRYRDTIRWRHDHAHFDAWREGRTGFPLVDAAMRQLAREGWMHNRARLVAGSFLTKDLGIDWRWGERWFMQRLIDGDEASNNGNWQWIASVGVDPQPAFRRIFNPARQQQRFDPDGAYVRRYVPELRGVPDRYLAEPAGMPARIQLDAGCVIGRDYPAPIVDHLRARRAALARYAEASAADLAAG